MHQIEKRFFPSLVKKREEEERRKREEEHPEEAGKRIAEEIIREAKKKIRFKDEHMSISTVIGVIFMVAIVVGIATTIFMYVSMQIPDMFTNKAMPDFQFIKTGSSLLLVRADHTMKWDYLIVTNTGNSTTAVYPKTGQMSAGQTIENITGNITVTYNNFLKGTWEFT